MRAGDLDTTIELFAVAAAVDDGYTFTEGTRTSQGTRRAKHIPAMRREIFEAAGREVKIPAVFEVRSDTLTRQITEAWQIKHNGVTFDVKGVQEFGRREGIRIEAMAADNGL